MAVKPLIRFASSGFGEFDYDVHGHPEVTRIRVRVDVFDYRIANKLAYPDEAKFYEELRAEIGKVRGADKDPALKQQFIEEFQENNFTWKGITLW